MLFAVVLRQGQAPPRPTAPVGPGQRGAGEGRGTLRSNVDGAPDGFESTRAAPARQEQGGGIL